MYQFQNFSFKKNISRIFKVVLQIYSWCLLPHGQAVGRSCVAHEPNEASIFHPGGWARSRSLENLYSQIHFTGICCNLGNIFHLLIQSFHQQKKWVKLVQTSSISCLGYTLWSAFLSIGKYQFLCLSNLDKLKIYIKSNITFTKYCF